MSEPPTGADRLTQEAMGHWYVRLLANGVSYFDASEVIPRVGSWGDWCRLWIERAALREREAEEMARAGRRLSAAEGYARAALAYHFAQFVYHEDPALKREAQEKKVACYLKALPDLRPPGERVAIPYEAATLPGILRIPGGPGEKGKPPCVVLISGLDSTKEEFHTLEAVLHARGLATLAFDGPAQGERADLSLRPDYEHVVTAVVDFLAGDRRVDPGRIGALGVSLGGYYCPRALAAEKRLRAGVASGGFYDMAGFWHTLPALAKQGLRHAFQAATEAETGERVKALSLRGRLAGLDRPLLVIGGEMDRLCPAEESRLMAQEAGRMAELVIYPEGGHVCNNIPFLWRPLAADWLAGKLGA